jgi:hypothetical protein
MKRIHRAVLGAAVITICVTGTITANALRTRPAEYTRPLDLVPSPMNPERVAVHEQHLIAQSVTSAPPAETAPVEVTRVAPPGVHDLTTTDGPSSANQTLADATQPPPDVAVLSVQVRSTTPADTPPVGVATDSGTEEPAGSSTSIGPATTAESPHSSAP